VKTPLSHELPLGDIALLAFHRPPPCPQSSFSALTTFNYNYLYSYFLFIKWRFEETQFFYKSSCIWLFERTSVLLETNMQEFSFRQCGSSGKLETKAVKIEKK
jgi:hypothetical protein